MSLRAFVLGLSGLLILVGAILVVLNRLRAFETCSTTIDFYGMSEVCTQSPTLLIVGMILTGLGLLTAIGAVLVD
ncbi:MAG: hypothetical protein WBB07_24150 [Mycobacterium sp.]